jgi:hypothetical protein
MRIFRVVLVSLTMLALGACTQTNFRAQDALARGSDSVEAPRILVMPVDVVLSELSFGGFPSPRADWTQAARRFRRIFRPRDLARRRRQDFADERCGRRIDQSPPI